MTKLSCSYIRTFTKFTTDQQNLQQMKMKQIGNYQGDVCHYASDEDKGRGFDYVLNSKRAKVKLLKGAKRSQPLEVVVKEGSCVNLLFSDGSYCKIVLPLLKIWHQQVNQTILINENEVKIEQSDLGFEDSRKHVDTKLVIIANDCRLVLHAYNTTQKLMIQGKNYEDFALKCLVPFFTKMINDDIEEIKKLNEDVKDALGIKKSKSCPQCPFTSTSNGNIKVHMKSCHTKPNICSPQKNKVPKILEEDISLLDDSEIKAIEMGEVPEIYKIEDMEVKCEWISCGYKAETPNGLSKHIEDVHMDYFRAKYLPLEDKNDRKPLLTFSEETELKQNAPEEKVANADERKTEDKKTHEDEDLEITNIEVFEEVPFKDCNPMKILHENLSISDISMNDISMHTNGNYKETVKTKNLEEPNGEVTNTNTSASFYCTECGEKFHEESQLDDHTEKAHEKQLVAEKTGRSEQNLNSTINDKLSRCDFCELTSLDQKVVEAHMQMKHGVIQCEKCEYGALDADILRKHMMTHTGNIIFTCYICEFEATKQSILEEHMESKHINKEVLPDGLDCDKCEKTFPTKFHHEFHKCKSPYKYPCHICEFSGLSVLEILSHINDDHFKCKSCNHISNTKEDLDVHIQLIHKDTKIDIALKDQNAL